MTSALEKRMARGVSDCTLRRTSCWSSFHVINAMGQAFNCPCRTWRYTVVWLRMAGRQASDKFTVKGWRVRQFDTRNDEVAVSEAVMTRRVSVFGLGAMGSTLARALLRAGHDVTVWNRSAGRIIDLVNEGATGVEAAEVATAASPLLVMCTIDKAATEAILRAESIGGMLLGKTVVNLSTGSCDDARRISDYVRQKGGQYIDGGIMAYPRDIGKAETTIVYSGDAEGFARHKAVLRAMAGKAEFFGDDPGTASVIYLALYAYYFGALTAFFEGAALAERAAVSPESFRKISGIMNTMLADGLSDITRRLTGGDYSGDQATVDVHYARQLVVRDAYISENIGYETTKAYLSYLERAQRAGSGQKDISIMYASVKDGS